MHHPPDAGMEIGMGRRFLGLLLGVGGLVPGVHPLRAQQPGTAASFSGATVSVSIERMDYKWESYDFLAVRSVALRPEGLGTEFSVLMPRYYPALLGLEVGPAVTLTNRHGALMLRGGVGLIFLVAPEAYLGAGAVLRIGGPVAVRIDIGARFLMTDYAWRRAGTAAIGLTFLTPPRPRCPP